MWGVCLVGWEICYTFVIMRKLVWEFLNSKYRNSVIYHQRFELHDRTAEKFITDDYESIMEFTRYHHGKDVRTRVNSFIRAHIKKYFDIDYFDIEVYVLDWCRNKSVKTIEM
jgi:hypothetical protein